MTAYVAGFLTFGNPKRVLLVLKMKGPPIVIGKWNAIGGKIETGENPHEAMRREFTEEAGVELDWKHGDCFARLGVGDHHVYFFHHRLAGEPLWKQREVEPIAVFPVDEVVRGRLPIFAYNLPHLMALAVAPRLRFAHLEDAAA